MLVYPSVTCVELFDPSIIAFSFFFFGGGGVALNIMISTNLSIRSYILTMLAAKPYVAVCRSRCFNFRQRGFPITVVMLDYWNPLTPIPWPFPHPHLLWVLGTLPPKLQSLSPSTTACDDSADYGSRNKTCKMLSLEPSIWFDVVVMVVLCGTLQWLRYLGVTITIIEWGVVVAVTSCEDYKQWKSTMIMATMPPPTQKTTTNMWTPLLHLLYSTCELNECTHHRSKSKPKDCALGIEKNSTLQDKFIVPWRFSRANVTMCHAYGLANKNRLPPISVSFSQLTTLQHTNIHVLTTSQANSCAETC